MSTTPEHIFDADVCLASQTRNVVGDWRISTSAPSTPSSSQQQVSSVPRRAGPGTTQRAAAPKPSRYATPEIESSSEEEDEGSAYEPSETEETAATSSWISPGSLRADWTPGMFSGLPPTVIVAGGAEYTLDPMHMVRDRIAQDIGEDKVTMIVPADALYDFLMAEWHEPERTEVLRELGAWVESL